MCRVFAGILIMCLAVAGSVDAQGFSGLARVLPDQSGISDTRRTTVLDLRLSQGVPYRVFTLNDPARLVLDFQEVDWQGVETDAFETSERVGSVHFGGYVPGWSRMVLMLAEPLAVDLVDLRIDDVTGSARLALVLVPVDAESFAESAGAPRDARWDLPELAMVEAIF